mgnify:CR=1 FL=1
MLAGDPKLVQLRQIVEVPGGRRKERGRGPFGADPSPTAERRVSARAMDLIDELAGDVREVALLQLAADIAVSQRLLYRFLGGAIELAFGKKKAGSQFQRLVAAIAPLSTSFYSGHV